ncbi:thioredoxin family protein [Abyssalbus ytuae]|uniref:Thioredoxin family protein n=1 Tax=Abyssalbus ytuae TaxID=2926907 RepID=A0A9E6ZJK5_9FLAO|nr:thioredoxin family protein [Abyssalbus ytuae]UOB16757.1 thioredoxin family protein [Abyssalbus ytuae]
MKNLSFLLCMLFSITTFSQVWEKDFQSAQDLASKENKHIILVFSGSDWCAPCIRLDKKVWQSKDFRDYAANHWVLYKADFPRKKANQLPEDITRKNKELADKYNPQGMLPLVFILNKDGEVIGKTGFKNISAKEYVEVLKAFEG